MTGSSRQKTGRRRPANAAATDVDLYRNGHVASRRRFRRAEVVRGLIDRPFNYGRRMSAGRRGEDGEFAVRARHVYYYIVPSGRTVSGGPRSFNYRARRLSRALLPSLNLSDTLLVTTPVPLVKQESVCPPAETRSPGTAWREKTDATDAKGGGVCLTRPGRSNSRDNVVT